MREQQSLWRYWLVEPLTWIFAAFVQPRRLEQALEAEYPQGVRRVEVFLRLLLPVIVVGYPLALLSRAELLPAHLASPDLTNFLANATWEFLGGLGVGLAFGLVFGVREALVGSLLGILTFGLAFDFLGVVGIAAGISGAALGIGLAGIFVLGLRLSSTANLGASLLAGIVAIAAVSLLLGLILASAGGLDLDSHLSVGLVVGLALTYVIGYLRLPFYLASFPSTIRAYTASRREPTEVFSNLHRSALYWDEYTSLPLPFLKQMLLLAYKRSPEETLSEIGFIRTQRSGQMRTARRVLEEIALRDLETRINLEQIAVAEHRLAELFPAEARLIDPRLALPLARLSDASRDAMRAISPISPAGREKALADLQVNLLKIQPRTAFRSQRLNARLARVMETWSMVGRQEQERLARTAQDVGNLANPYKPGQFLSLKDSLFVGRRNLAQELEGALSMGSRRPTFLLNGERRMGKTSALQQLPFLLGSSYVSVFYNLQQPGLYASASTFLGVLADGITRALNARAMPVESLVYDVLRSQYRDASIYSYFERWLTQVEALLERDDRTLLLAFDEFEMLEEIEQSKYMDVRLLLDWMRSIIQFHGRIALLFSGVKIFTEMGSQSGIDWAGYFINVQMLRISFLRPEEGRHLVLKPTADFPGEQIFSPEVVEAIITETGCHPFLLQAVCSALITGLNVQRRMQAAPGDVTVAVERVLEDWGGHFAHLWNRTDKEQRACLEALLSLQRATLEQLAVQTQMEIRVARRVVQQLLRRDLVAHAQDDGWEIAVPMFQRWLEHNI